jgi:hypothetical protein
MTKTQTLEPVLVWDSRRDHDGYFNWMTNVQRNAEWVNKHLTQSPGRTYRVEFFMLGDQALALMYGYKVCKHGNVMQDPITLKPVTENPVLMRIKALPPGYSPVAAD